MLGACSHLQETTQSLCSPSPGATPITLWETLTGDASGPWRRRPRSAGKAPPSFSSSSCSPGSTSFISAATGIGRWFVYDVCFT